MIQHIWSVLCQSAAIDAQTNRVSLFQVMETVVFANPPSPEHPVSISCEILSLWMRESNKPITGELQIILTTPDVKIGQPIFLDIDLTQSLFSRTRLNISTMKLLACGMYEFTIQYREKGTESWLTATRLPFIVEPAK